MFLIAYALYLNRYADADQDVCILYLHIYDGDMRVTVELNCSIDWVSI